MYIVIKHEKHPQYKTTIRRIRNAQGMHRGLSDNSSQVQVKYENSTPKYTECTYLRLEHEPLIYAIPQYYCACQVNAHLSIYVCIYELN